MKLAYIRKKKDGWYLTVSTAGESYIGLSKCKIMNFKGKVYEMFGFFCISAQQQHHIGSGVLPQSPLFIKAHLSNTDEFKYDWEKAIKKGIHRHTNTHKHTHTRKPNRLHTLKPKLYTSQNTLRYLSKTLCIKVAHKTNIYVYACVRVCLHACVC